MEAQEVKYFTHVCFQGRLSWKLERQEARGPETEVMVTHSSQQPDVLWAPVSLSTPALELPGRVETYSVGSPHS